ncbi:hypothetical protein [Pseudoduganella violaceinigra]|uniref:hypothetical protein n=1 Tax=Pseudoduganella violaceinigra TaxID=246602 RepID=UPI00047FA969|nr:hypothetical protein [Pseudoduganella violaceinigra]
MSGLNISCGDFRADEKSGSPLERVLRDLPGLTDEIRQEILAGFDAGEYTQVAPAIAIGIIPQLRAYRESLVSEIGHSDHLREMAREENAGACSVKLKWGEGRGWRLYCAVNLLAACEHAAVTHEPVLVSLD